MKKLLKVSFVAMLVAAPFAANATLPATYANDAGTNNAASAPSLTATADVASTSYVKGAYNSAIGYINELNTAKLDASVASSTYATKTELNGKQNTIDSSNKLDADLVDDSTSTNKFVTETEKTTWGAKQDQLTNGTNDVSAIVATTVRAASSADDTTLVTEAAVRTAVDNAITAATYNDTALSGRVTTLENAGYITKSVNDLTNYTTTTDMNTALAGKQDKIDADHKLAVGLVDGALSATDAESTYETQTHAAQTYATQADLGNKSSLSSDFTAEQKADVVTAVNAAMAQAKTASAAKKVTVHTTWGSDSTTAPADVLVNAQ